MLPCLATLAAAAAIMLLSDRKPSHADRLLPTAGVAFGASRVRSCHVVDHVYVCLA